jgi:flagellar hook protein FlgE
MPSGPAFIGWGRRRKSLMKRFRILLAAIVLFAGALALLRSRMNHYTMAWQSEQQAIRINLGSTGGFGSGLTSYAGDSSMASRQDGYPNGTLTSVQISANGVVTGLASNGAQIPMAQLAIAYFRNPHGLENVGSNFFRSGLSSGEVQIASSGGPAPCRSSSSPRSWR